MPLTAEARATEILTCAAVLKRMLIKFGTVARARPLLPTAFLSGLTGPESGADQHKKKAPQEQQPSLAASVRSRTRSPSSGCSTRDCYRDGERERESGAVCVWGRERQREKGGVWRERAIVVHKHTCRHRKKPKDGESVAHTQPRIQIRSPAHAPNTPARHCSENNSDCLCLWS